MKRFSEGKPAYITGLLVMMLVHFDSAWADSNERIAHPVLSWVPPLSNNQFDNWKLASSSVALRDKIILSPTGRDLYGFV